DVILAWDQRVGHTNLREPFGSQDATIAATTWPSVGLRVVAAVCEAVVQTEGNAAADDLGLRERDERRVDAKSAAVYAGSRRQRRQRFERAYELGPAIRIARVIERVDADHEI